MKTFNSIWDISARNLRLRLDLQKKKCLIHLTFQTRVTVHSLKSVYEKPKKK